MIRVQNVSLLLTTLALAAQDPTTMDLQALRQGAGSSQQSQTTPTDATPKASQQVPQDTPETLKQRTTDQERLQAEIAFLKAKEKAPRRFAQDLFSTRQNAPTSTEGGISDDYVLGVGDQIQLNAFGSATFELPARVDGRGEVVIPKVGTVKVAGMNLARARAAVQTKVAQQFSKTTVDVSLVKLREVRVFVLGEVYCPGSYLVPSLSSLVNVLALSGGPTAAGSYRQVRVLRGGKVIHQIDLYPLRAEGLGNMNFLLQSGDTLFVPLAFNQVTLEGAFTRVVAATGDLLPRDKEPRPTQEMQKLQQEIRLEEDRLAALTPIPQKVPGTPNALPSASSQSQSQSQTGVPTLSPFEDKYLLLGSNTSARDAAQAGIGQASSARTDASGQELPGTKDSRQDPTQLDAYGRPSLYLSNPDRTASLERLVALRRMLADLKKRDRGDNRLNPDPDRDFRAEGQNQEATGLPGWLSHWMEDGKAPSMQFELLPGETALDALRYSGGMALEAFVGNLSLRRPGQGGVLNVVDIPLDQAGSAELRRGDVLSALYSRERVDRVVTLSGWVRVPGSFARTEGLRVGDLLKRESQTLPDTYLHRGEIIRTLPDLSTRYLAFDVAKAMDGDESQNLPLENRDRIELFRTNDLRLPQTVTVLGPVTRPGIFPFHEGMRVSDVLFQAGVPLRGADRMIAEVAHTRSGKASEVKQLDLVKLLSTDQASPVQLKDEAVNPLLEPYDQVSMYNKPDYHAHRTVNLIGQVTRPGFYALDADKVTLKELLARAGGLTPDAMPQGTIFLRQMAKVNRADVEIEGLEAKDPKAKDPTSNGINSILDRLSETKRQPTTGNLLTSPLLHGLGSGNLNRMIVNVSGILSGDTKMDVDLQDGDAIIIPHRTEAAYVVGETASPFMTYKMSGTIKVRDLLKIAGGTTRNADESNIRLLKADGRILDRSIMGQEVEPGDAVLVPQRIRRDSTWQENLQALTPLALLLNAIKVP